MVRFQCDVIKAHLSLNPEDVVLFGTPKPPALMEDLRALIPEYDLKLVEQGVEVRAPHTAK